MNDYSTPFRSALGYPLDSGSTYPPLKDLMHVLMRREIEPLFSNTVSLILLLAIPDAD